ncbi:MAG: dienelactone hydrolase family protein [Verrucomicrobiota bacterium JB022]|nr:dienelactone hydrolase family protein [Verrucomicrobiota bacterium JB022]
MSQPTEYQHLFERPSVAGAPVWVLLHGTGGDAHDLVPVVDRINPGAGHLALQGPVLEGPMRRFFKRLREGVFDQESLRVETSRLDAFLARAVEAYRLQDVPLVGLGFSNGANLLASYLLSGGKHLGGAVLWRPMTPYQPVETRVGQAPVLMLSGTHDGMATREDVEGLARLLAVGGAAVDHQFLPAGHNLLHEDFDRTVRWVQEQGWQTLYNV